MKFTVAGIDLGVTAKFVKEVYGFPDSPKDEPRNYHNQFRVKILSYNGVERTFLFHDSTKAYYDGKDTLTEDDLRGVLESIITEALPPIYRDFAEFCREFGYDADSRLAETTYKEIQKNRAKVLELGLTDSQINSILEAMHEEE